MRQKMSHMLCSLELVYYETKIGRQLTEEERLERYTNWDIGLNMENLKAYYYTAVSQQEAEEQKLAEMLAALHDQDGLPASHPLSCYLSV